jgi:hypothetical protein
MILSESVLIESKSARDDQLQNVSNERAEQILGKVKGLMFACGKELALLQLSRCLNILKRRLIQFALP